MKHFCTYCDQGYAARLLCLHDSLLAQGEPFRLHVLCFDTTMEAVVAAVNQPTLVAIAMAEFLRVEPDYAAVRSQRTPVEFYFTATPVLVRHCLQREPTAETVTYLDADLWFFGPASAVFATQQGASVAIVPHRFPPALAQRVVYGIYNVAWVSFCRDLNGLAALAWWRERCLEWCHDRVEAGRFADQGYLDEFPRRFGGVRVIEHPGVNAAPWNMRDVRVEAASAGVQVDGQALLFYHFQGIREVAPGWFEPGLRPYGLELTRPLRDLIYGPYLQRLAAVQALLRARHGLAPRFLHQRLNTGNSMRARWERFKARWVIPSYGRLRGRLVHAAEPRRES